jgi:aldose 1-epimerase
VIITNREIEAAMTQRRVFGKLGDGTEIDEVVITAGELSVSIISWGAVIRDLRYRGQSRTLGFERLEDYPAHSPHCGAIAGRYANRIAEGRFTLDGTNYQLDRNEGGRNHLHGGTKAFGKRPWQIIEASNDSVTLQLVSADGEAGYPGQVTATCRYQVTDDNALTLTLEAITDRATIINLAGHSYFNLDGSADILSHELQINADHYTPVDQYLIPTGEISTVAGTPFDFRQLRAVKSETQAYDHNFVLNTPANATPRTIATVIGPASRTRLDVESTEPGVQFYDAAKLNVPVPGLHGRRYGPHGGLALEAQRFPDTPNHPNFGSAVLRPSETYRQITCYRFSAI